MPISRVRSVTLTSMMFITPIPPTSSEIAATSPSSVVNTLLVELEVSSSEPWLRTLKPGSAVSVILCRSSRIWRDLGFGGVERGFGLRLDGDRVDRPEARQRVLHGRDRRHHDVVLVGCAVGALFREHADDFVVAAVDLHVLPDGARAGEQFLHDFLADHRHALVLGDVGLR